MCVLQAFKELLDLRAHACFWNVPPPPFEAKFTNAIPELSTTLFHSSIVMCMILLYRTSFFFQTLL